jgi:hypothetical protein
VAVHCLAHVCGDRFAQKVPAPTDRVKVDPIHTNNGFRNQQVCTSRLDRIPK